DVLWSFPRPVSTRPPRVRRCQGATAVVASVGEQSRSVQMESADGVTEPEWAHRRLADPATGLQDRRLAAVILEGAKAVGQLLRRQAFLGEALGPGDELSPGPSVPGGLLGEIDDPVWGGAPRRRWTLDRAWQRPPGPDRLDWSCATVWKFL